MARDIGLEYSDEWETGKKISNHLQFAQYHFFLSNILTLFWDKIGSLLMSYNLII